MLCLHSTRTWLEVLLLLLVAHTQANGVRSEYRQRGCTFLLLWVALPAAWAFAQSRYQNTFVLHVVGGSLSLIDQFMVHLETLARHEWFPASTHA